MVAHSVITMPLGMRQQLAGVTCLINIAASLERGLTGSLFATANLVFVNFRQDLVTS